MSADLVLYMYENLEHFGEILMVDGKAIQSFGTKIISKNSKSKNKKFAKVIKGYQADTGV